MLTYEDLDLTYTKLKLNTPMQKLAYEVLINSPESIPEYLKKVKNPGYFKKLLSSFVPLNFGVELDVINTVAHKTELYNFGFIYNSYEFPQAGYTNEMKCAIQGYYQLANFKKYLETIANDKNRVENGGIHIHLYTGISSDGGNLSQQYIKYCKNVSRATDRTYTPNHLQLRRLLGMPEENQRYHEGRNIYNQGKLQDSFAASRDNYHTIEYRILPVTLDYRVIVQCVIELSQDFNEFMLNVYGKVSKFRDHRRYKSKDTTKEFITVYENWPDYKSGPLFPLTL